uniref:Uncharacterized protein n=1 Tax=viral metagenome TaxID=1070528 RepID=A0A6C0BN95_9ZZZZ
MSNMGQREFRVVILGKGGVGKTEFLKRCGAQQTGNIYTLHLKTTAGDVVLKLCDGLFTNDIHGAVYMYDITNEQTFSNVLNLKNHLSRVTDPEMPALIVGNKLDLLWDRRVDVGEAALYNLPFVEVSAKNGVNLDFALITLVRLLINDAECAFVQ